MISLAFFFLYAFTLAITLPYFFPSLTLIYFAPFLIICFYRYRKTTCLWLALLAGVSIDLFAAHTRLGFFAMVYLITTFSLYTQQRNFFEDRLSTLPIMTFLFALLSTLLQLPLLYVFEQSIDLSLEWIKNDLILNPMGDAFYALVAFTFPKMLLYKPKPRRPSMVHFKNLSS